MKFDIQRYFLFEGYNINHNDIINTLTDADYLNKLEHGKYIMKSNYSLKEVADLFPNYITRKIHKISLFNVFTTYLVEISNGDIFKLTHRNNITTDKPNIFIKTKNAFCNIKDNSYITQYNLEYYAHKMYVNSLLLYIVNHTSDKIAETHDPQFEKDVNTIISL